MRGGAVGVAEADVIQDAERTYRWIAFPSGGRMAVD